MNVSPSAVATIPDNLVITVHPPYHQELRPILTDSEAVHPTLEFFPSRRLREVPPEDLRPWPFPSFLDNPASSWLQTLKAR